MESNTTLSLEEECDRDRDCLFVAGDGLFKVWHVILIAAAITILVLVVVLRFIKCPRLPEEARKKKELERRRQELGENGTIAHELSNTDGHLMPHPHSSYEGNVDQPLDSPGNVDLPLTPAHRPQDDNVMYNPSAEHKPPARTRHSHEPSDSVELRYTRSRTTSEVRDSSYYHENAGAYTDPSPSQHNGNSPNLFLPVMSTSTRI